MRGRRKQIAIATILTTVLCSTIGIASEEEEPVLDSVLARADSPEGGREYITGNFYVARGPMDRGFPIMVTQAFDRSTGELDWEAGTWGPSGLSATGRAVAVSPDGTRVYAAGYTEVCLEWDSETYPHDCLDRSGAFHTVAYETAHGTALWEGSLPGFTWGATAVAVSPAGDRIFVTGSMDGDYYTLAYETDSGKPVWSSRYDGPASGADAPLSITVSDDGETVIVSGNTDIDRSNLSGRTVRIAYDAESGDRLSIAREETGGERTVASVRKAKPSR